MFVKTKKKKKKKKIEVNAPGVKNTGNISPEICKSDEQKSALAQVCL